MSVRKLTLGYGYSKESSGVCSRRRGAVATAVQRRVRGQPHAAAAGSGASRQPLDQATGMH